MVKIGDYYTDRSDGEIVQIEKIDYNLYEYHLIVIEPAVVSNGEIWGINHFNETYTPLKAYNTKLYNALMED